MTKSLLAFFVSTLAMAGAGSCLAAGSEAGLNTYLGVDAGYVRFKNQSSLASILVGTVGGTATSVQDSGVTVGRIYFGVGLSENFGLEVGYLFSGDAKGTFAGVAANRVAYSGTVSTTYAGGDYALLLRPGVASGANGFFVKVGGHAIGEKDAIRISNGGGSGVSGQTTSGSGLMYGLGFEGNIGQKGGYRVAYSGYKNIAGVSGNDANVLTVGAAYHF